ncbi:hypothetical protein [Streptomyces sp. NPDC003077]|uniref:hypothetical protein n=1 Tax=Streptomyces sp. NPDC003077 TaxID=3154443 RepID=UPI0033BED3AB
MKPTAPEKPRTSRKRIALWAALALILVGGGTTGYVLATRDSDPGCEHLLNSEPLRQELGARMRPGMSCGELGAALRGAATGPTPGRHTLAQARIMRATVTAISEDIAQRKDPVIAPALREPVATALADYSADTFEILAGVNGDYDDHDAPWRDGAVVRTPVKRVDVVRTMRAVSENPSAYATLRTAQTRQCAIGLAGVPLQATGAALRVSARDCGAGLGYLDGIADDIPQATSHTWRAAVISHLTTGGTTPPAYREDPVRHLTATWQQDLSRKQPKETGFLKRQLAELVRTWVAGRGTPRDESTVGTLQDAVARDASTSVGETAEIMQCTRQPEEHPCA